MKYQAAVITVSDKGSVGERVDTSGPAVRAMLEGAGYEVVYTSIVPDDKLKIGQELTHCADALGCDQRPPARCFTGRSLPFRRPCCMHALPLHREPCSPALWQAPAGTAWSSICRVRKRQRGKILPLCWTRWNTR